KNHGSHCGPSARGSRLDADHPENGVLIPRRNSGSRRFRANAFLNHVIHRSVGISFFKPLTASHPLEPPHPLVKSCKNGAVVRVSPHIVSTSPTQPATKPERMLTLLRRARGGPEILRELPDGRRAAAPTALKCIFFNYQQELNREFCAKLQWLIRNN